jgi:hypothetical protein
MKRTKSNTTMKRSIMVILTSFLAFGAAAFAGDNDEKLTGPLNLLDDGWHFTRAVPAILPSFNGEVGLYDLHSQIDVPADKVIRNLDMAAFFRGEVSKGRFGVMADFITMSLSGKSHPEGLVKSLDVHFDEIIGEPALRWRILEGRRGWLDGYAGVRYLNLYQSLDIKPNRPRIEEASSALVDAVGNRLRAALGGGEFRDLIGQNVTSQIADLENFNPPMPAAPIAGREPGRIRDQIQEIIEARKQALAEAIRDRIEAATDELRQQAQGA